MSRKRAQKLITRSCLGLLLITGCVTSALAFVWAHEGHHALPTKGAKVDGNTIYLSEPARKAIGLATAQVDLMDLENAITATATLTAPWKQSAFVTTKLGGRLHSVLVRPGDLVEEGQKLAEIESLELENEQLELIRFQLELELAEQTLDRVQTLGERGIIPERDVRTAETTKLEKTAALEIARRKLIGLGLSTETIEDVLQKQQPVRMLPVFSPASGLIVHADVQPGQIVEPTDHLFDILDLSKVWAKGMVVEGQSYRVQNGQPVELTLAALPSRTFRGKVDYLSLQVDETSRALPVWVVLDNASPADQGPSFEASAVAATAPLLRPGMFGSMRITTDRVIDAIVCPTRALITAGAETYVFVQRKPGEYVRRDVVLGLSTPRFIEVKKGLFPGDQVVVTGSHQLSSFFVQGVLTLTLEAQRNIKLEVEPVGERSVDDVVSVNGVVEVPPDKKGFASSRIPGKIARIMVNLGQLVRAGDTLAEVESLEFQNRQLELIQAQTRRLLAQDLLTRARSLKGIVAEQEVLLRQVELQKIENELGASKRLLSTLGLASEDIDRVLETGKTLDALPVKAPIDGHLVHFEVTPGQYVKAQDPLFEIHDFTTVWVRGFVFEKDMARIQLGQTARIRLAANPTLVPTGRLVRTNYVLGGSERILSVWVELENSWPEPSGDADGSPGEVAGFAAVRQPLLKENMLARLAISTGQHEPAIAIPASALLHEGSETYVFVKRPERGDFFERRSVRIGRRDDRYVQIRSGLTPGDLVAVGGVQELRTAYASVR